MMEMGRIFYCIQYRGSVVDRMGGIPHRNLGRVMTIT